MHLQHLKDSVVFWYLALTFKIRGAFAFFFALGATPSWAGRGRVSYGQKITMKKSSNSASGQRWLIFSGKRRVIGTIKNSVRSL